MESTSTQPTAIQSVASKFSKFTGTAELEIDAQVDQVFGHSDLQILIDALTSSRSKEEEELSQMMTFYADPAHGTKTEKAFYDMSEKLDVIKRLGVYISMLTFDNFHAFRAVSSN